MQGNTSALASNFNGAPPTTLLTGQEDNNVSLEEDELKQQLLEVTPGSSEAEDLMEILETVARKISHPNPKLLPASWVSLQRRFGKTVKVCFKVISMVLCHPWCLFCRGYVAFEGERRYGH
jgi:hypothetical protein